MKEGLKCPRGDLCPFAHNIFECWLHPTRYRTQLCNEPASCRRKVCFFAHTLEELREPSNPLDTVPQGGQNSAAGAAAAADSASPEARHSLDSLTRSTFNIVSAPALRHSIDVAMPQQHSAPQMTSTMSAVQQLFPAALQNLNQATGTGLNMSDLASALQQLTVSVGSNRSLQNERIVQLLLMLLGEVTNQASGRNDGNAFSNAAAGLNGVPRFSVDNAGLAQSTGYVSQYDTSTGVQWPVESGGSLTPQSISEHTPLRPPTSRMSMDNYIPYNVVGHHRGASIDPIGASAVSEAMSAGFCGMGRVSMDAALLTGGRSNGGSVVNRTSSAVEHVLSENYRNSSDSMESDETLQTRRDSGEVPLPDAFILH